MLHGPSALQAIGCDRIGNTCAVEFVQFNCVGSLPFACTTAAVIVPPPGVTPSAPVGMVLSPIPPPAVCPMKSEIGAISYIIPAPARITVLPVPHGSHANPSRGAKLLC